MKNIKLWVISLAVGIFALAFWSRLAPAGANQNSGAQVSFAGDTMGTTYQVQIAGDEVSPEELTALKQRVDAELLEVNKAMSTYMPESEISRFNRYESTEAFPVTQRFREVLVRSLKSIMKPGRCLIPLWGP